MDVLIATRTTVDEVGSSRHVRPHVSGKFLWLGDEKLFVRGVTYGTFGPNGNDEPFPEPERAASDLEAMRAAGINCVRTYTPPPRWLLDAAHRHGLLILAGLPWEQHIAFLDDAGRAGRIEDRVRAMTSATAGHPALLGFTVGNEIPGDVVRWHGKVRIERFLERLVEGVNAEDPGALVTYVNFPTTEYLDLPFLDFLSFNVYLEERDRLEAYLARLQNLAGDNPLVMAEVGLDSRRNGLEAQAETLSWQVESVFEAGSAGCFVFAWTDEWFRGGTEIEDWDFGLVDRDRKPKPALAAVRTAYAEAPFGGRETWPKISVAICSYNGGRTIADALEGATQLDYPNFEVIVVDDGSTDDTAEIASRFPVKLIRTENRGLSAARNEAWSAATGEIVAYTDDDARPDPHWLRFLATTFRKHDVAGAGGPNVPPSGDGLVASCVANAPGGPMHVLIDDVVAEHIPGCNMAFRKDVLDEVGGFDPRFRAAGDDVDMCWRVQDAGYEIAFSPAALVWHHRRNDIHTYWKQQQGYGKAEALLEAKWPARYNVLGHLHWRGRIYGSGLVGGLRLLPERIYHGQWGLAPFQSVYQPRAELAGIAAMPEIYLVSLLLLLLGLLGFAWPPLLWAWLVLGIALAIPVAQAVGGAVRADFPEPASSPRQELIRRLVTGWLHLIQPIARLRGRIMHGLTPWRIHGSPGWSLPVTSHYTSWSETWRAPEQRLEDVEEELRSLGAVVIRGGQYDDWDLEVRSGLFASVRLSAMTEEHGQGKQNWRMRASPKIQRAMWFPLTVGVLALLALLSAETGVAIALAALGAAGLARALWDAGRGCALVRQVLEEPSARTGAEAEVSRA